MAVVAKETCRIAGFRAMVVKGAVYDDNDPVVKAAAWLFDTPDGAATAAKKPQNTDELGERSMSARKRTTDVEQATKAPGEKRNVKKKG